MTKYPTGICNAKQLAINILYVIFMIASIISIPLILLLVVKCEMWIVLLTIVGLVVVLSGIYVTINTFINPIPKILTEFSFYLNYDLFDRKLTLIEKNKINDDTKNYILTLKANVLSAINVKESNELFETIKEPKFKNYKKVYELVQIYYYINKQDFENANACLTNYKSKYRKDKNIPLIEKTIKVYSSEEKIDGIEQIFKINSYSIFDNLNNANLLAYYFDKQKDKEKALYYASMILEKKTCLEEFNKLASAITIRYTKKQ